jgi:fructuronate reductase
MTWEVRILHLGLGRFHRGHQAAYYQKLADRGDFRWGVCAFSMRSTGARDEMRELKCKYDVVEWSEDGSKTSSVESIRRVGDVSADRELLRSCFESPTTELITLTVTEKGYALTAQGELDFSNPEIMHDLLNPDRPRSTIGILAWGLRLRQRSTAPGLTILSCDNLRDNGGNLKRAVRAFQEKLGWTSEASWCASHVTFPGTMVDRIVPAASAQTPAGQITTESFSQWVIADDFIGHRPPWETVGVEYVSDVRPFEDMKLRLLNAAHSLLAYGGALRGHRFVHEAVTDTELRSRIEQLFSEVVPVLEIPRGFDVTGYTRRLLERFNNSNLPHSLQQIAMDGSQKLPQRILPSIQAARDRGLPTTQLAQVISDWQEYVWQSLHGMWDLKDPLATLLQRLDRTNRANWDLDVQKLSDIHLR